MVRDMPRVDLSVFHDFHRSAGRLGICGAGRARLVTGAIMVLAGTRICIGWPMYALYDLQVRWRFVATAIMLFWIVCWGKRRLVGAGWYLARSQRGFTASIRRSGRFEISSIGCRHGFAVVIRYPGGTLGFMTQVDWVDQQQVYMAVKSTLYGSCALHV